ncbi:MAG TPA: putative toxin-antitoxin system toxin component, PIN family [Pyrinomonadaceae bacterium]|nr:putative toxin-antitoxin system toxin component, PIN family [Pyrinomonadaceae bacterium]
MNRNKNLSAVFDCMIFLQAAISEKSPAAEIFRQVERDNVLLFVGDEILAEVREVLNRPKILAKNPHLTIEYVEAFLSRVLKKAKLIKKIPKRFEYPRDPKDEKYINLAVEAKADYIVSRDNDLLDLMTGTDIESKEFRQRFRPLKIIEPLEFLKIIQEDSSLIQ